MSNQQQKLADQSTEKENLRTLNLRLWEQVHSLELKIRIENN